MKSVNFWLPPNLIKHVDEAFRGTAGSQEKRDLGSGDQGTGSVGARDLWWVRSLWCQQCVCLCVCQQYKWRTVFLGFFSPGHRLSGHFTGSWKMFRFILQVSLRSHDHMVPTCSWREAPPPHLPDEHEWCLWWSESRWLRLACIAEIRLLWPVSLGAACVSIFSNSKVKLYLQSNVCVCSHTCSSQVCPFYSSCLGLRISEMLLFWRVKVRATSLSEQSAEAVML